MIGKRLAHFRIVEKLGEGGMGVVYRAEDEKLGRQVALKVLHTEFVTDEERRKRFIREARTAAAVSHPHIAGIHQIDEEDGIIFIAMELVEGRTLKALIDGRPLQSDACLTLAVEVAEGLARAHEHNIVHRDLKPENIIVGADGHAKILDFGLAKLYDTTEGPFTDETSGIQTISAAVTREGRILGTVAYMSPEQARGLEVDPRSDVFTFGVVLYEMATGKSPFQGATITDTLTAILRDPQPPVAHYNPQIPAELERIMARCLEKDPDDRYQNAGEILGDLRALKKLSDSQPVPLVSDSLVGLRRLRPFWKRPAVWAATALLVIAAAIVVPQLGGWIGSNQAVPSLEDALAVLPFENLQNDDDPERLGQILQELIIADLSELASPRVLSSQRLFDVQRQLGRSERNTIDRDMAGKVARGAGARTMLTGTLSRLGPSWTVTTQLIDVEDGTVIKSERLDGSDLYAMVDNLTGLVRMDLGVATGGAGADLAVKDRTSASLDAYQAFLRGVDLLNALDFDQAVESFDEAVRIDPTFGQAYYKLAIARWWSRSLSKMEMGQSVENPGFELRALLEGEVKLSSKDRMLAEAFLALVETHTREARPLFEEALRRHPDEKEAWYGLGEALYHSPDGPATRLDALEPFEKAIELDPSFALAYYHLIDLYLQDERYDEGIEKARTFIEEDPENPAWYLAWVRAVVAKGDPAEIEASIDEALGLIDDPAMQRQLLHEAAMALEMVNQFDRADALLARALEVPAEDSPAELLAARGGVALYQGEPARGERFFRQALEADPESGKALSGLFKMLDGQRRYPELIRLARGLSAKHPSESRHYAQWLSAAVESGNDGEAKAAWTAIEARIDDGTLDAAAAGDLWQARVRAHFEVRDLLSARDFARQALTLTPDNHHPTLLAHLGWSELGLGQLDEAEGHFTEAIEGDHSLNGALMGLSQVATLKGDPEAAIRYAERLNEQTGGSVWGRARLVEALLRNGEQARADEIARQDGELWHKGREESVYFRELAMAYLGAGMPVRAEGALRRIVGAEADSGDTQALFRLGWALMLQGKLDRAREVLDKATEREPQNGELLYSLAVNDLLHGNAEAAETRLGGLLSEGPVIVDGHVVRAYALAELGRHEEAEASAERAMAMNPNRDSRAALAWAQVNGGSDLEGGLWLAEEAMVLPGDYYDAMFRLAFTAPPEHTAGLAFLKLERYEEAVAMLEAAEAGRPDRASIQADLDRARPRVSRKSP